MYRETQSAQLSRSSRHGTRRPILMGIALVAMMVLSMLVVPVTFADGGRDVLIQDKCDPATFNAALGPGACVGNGDVTLDEFLEKLNPHDGGHDAWRFSRDTLSIKRGEVVHVASVGGEAHSFTEVTTFGGGFIPLLNTALPAGTPPATPVVNPDLLTAALATLVLPGQSNNLSNLAPGQHKFQCLIHPWMRTVIQVGNS